MPQPNDYGAPAVHHACLIWAIVVSTGVSAHTARPIPQIPTAFAIRAEIDEKGAKADANQQTDWDRVMSQISSANVAYIALVPDLAPGTDAGASEDLGIALAHALPLAPRAVLRATVPGDGPTGVGRVCGIPFIEETAKDLPGYVRATRSAVVRVRTPELQAVKADCLHELAEAAKRLATLPPARGR